MDVKPQMDSSDRGETTPIDDALAEYFRRIDQGAAVNQEAFCAEYPEIAVQLRSYFLKEQKLAPSGNSTLDHAADSTPGNSRVPNMPIS